MSFAEIYVSVLLLGIALCLVAVWKLGCLWANASRWLAEHPLR